MGIVGEEARENERRARGGRNRRRPRSLLARRSWIIDIGIQLDALRGVFIIRGVAGEEIGEGRA